jgi:hypothetical protein
MGTHYSPVTAADRMSVQALLQAKVMGRWFHLYLYLFLDLDLDLYNRKIVGAEVHDSDDSGHAARRVAAARLRIYRSKAYATWCRTRVACVMPKCWASSAALAVLAAISARTAGVV